MTLKPSLSLRMGQQLRMTPQLQQAIRLLQLSSIELQLEIRQALDSNFMLEETEAENEEDHDTPEEPAAEIAETGVDGGPISEPETDDEVMPDTSTEVATESIAEDLPVDTSWNDVYDDTYTPKPNLSDENFLETQNAEEVTVRSHLLEQINLLHLTEADEFIATAVIDGLDENGVLQVSIEDVLEITPPEWETTLEEVEAVLHMIQHLDPAGIAARSLQECLTIQLKQLPPDTPCKDTALKLVENYLGRLASHDYTLLGRKLKVREDYLKRTIELILTMNPRPGNAIGSNRADYIEPDVIVSRRQDGWLVALSPGSTPRIRVNPEYAALVRRGDNDDGADHLRNHLQEARWFIKSLQQRNDTLLKVSKKIVEHQRGFLEYGERAMKPLVLHDIAEAVGLHESTISRVTTRKYMLTPSGVFELKYFFSSHVSTSTGGEVSSTAIRALIKKLIGEENPRKPLSDNKIAGLLKGQNIKIARRTVAKYRELLLIPPSNERKQLI